MRIFTTSKDRAEQYCRESLNFFAKCAAHRCIFVIEGAIWITILGFRGRFALQPSGLR
jgi:hypothetical protein